MTEQKKVAFALGGLGGMNAHGAGFLAAAHDVAHKAERDDSRPLHILPGLEFISCSSGMIHWTAQYLRGADLRSQLAHEIEVVKQKSGLPPGPLFDPWRSLMVTTWKGLPGVFRPLVETYGQHLLSCALSMFNPSAPTVPPMPPTFDELWDLLLPSRLFIPTREERFFEEIAQTFNDETDIGIAFNSFNLPQGVEYLHVNERGLELIRRRYDPDAAYDKEKSRTIYKRIDGEYVQAGLWLFEYGFDRTFKGDYLTDGAYRRHIILDELAFADRIYVPRPVNSKWLGRLPKNVFEREDLKIETWFNASYQRQSRLMNHISEDVREKKKSASAQSSLGTGIDTNGYHDIDLVELDIRTQQGFFHYFTEHMEVFEDAYHDSMEKLAEKELV